MYGGLVVNGMAAESERRLALRTADVRGPMDALAPRQPRLGGGLVRVARRALAPRPMLYRLRLARLPR